MAGSRFWCAAYATQLIGHAAGLLYLNDTYSTNLGHKLTNRLTNQTNSHACTHAHAHLTDS